jgi:hypothetical protein
VEERRTIARVVPPRARGKPVFEGIAVGVSESVTFMSDVTRFSHVIDRGWSSVFAAREALYLSQFASFATSAVSHLSLFARRRRCLLTKELHHA